MPPDFASSSYWSERFAHEDRFEWLVGSDDLLPLIAKYAPQGQLKVLHFGAGTSTLGRDLAADGRLQVVDADYVEDVMVREQGEARYSRIGLDVLSLRALQDVTPHGGWGLYVDKSTADAISCGAEDAFPTLCANLSACARSDAVWISISYSASRYDNVQGWVVKEKLALKTTGGQKGSVWEPEVVTAWAYVLSRE